MDASPFGLFYTSTLCRYNYSMIGGIFALARLVFVDIYTMQHLNIAFIRQSFAKYNKSKKK